MVYLSEQSRLLLLLATHGTLPFSISVQTVVTYVRRIYEKLGVNSRKELLKKLLASEPSIAWKHDSLALQFAEYPTGEGRHLYQALHACNLQVNSRLVST